MLVGDAGLGTKVDTGVPSDTQPALLAKWNTRQESNLRALGSKPNGDAGNPRLVYWIQMAQSVTRGITNNKIYRRLINGATYPSSPRATLSHPDRDSGLLEGATLLDVQLQVTVNRPRRGFAPSRNGR